MQCECGKMCKTLSGLKNHKNVCKRPEGTPIVMLHCDTCNKSFKNLVLHKHFCKGLVCHQRVCENIPDTIIEEIKEIEEIDDSPLEMIIRGGSNNGKKIRKTDDTPKRVSLYDVINIATNSDQAKKTFQRLKEHYPEVVFGCHHFQFEGHGQRPTPVVDARGLYFT